MSNKDVARSVSEFMIASAPTLAEATPMGYELLKQLARALVYNLKTTKEHAEYVMFRKYSHIYASSVITRIVNEGMADEIANRVETARANRAKKKALAQSQQRPMLVC